MTQVTKAVIPVAGLGTRFLPATKALPKEMLPVVDKPAIQYVVEEATAAGLHDVLMVTGRNKNALENHFDRATELEATLMNKGDSKRLADVKASTELGEIHYMRQGDPRGLGHAVHKAKQHVGNEPFAVLLGDDLIHSDETLLKDMLAATVSTGTSVIALMEVDPSQTHLYGIATVEETGQDGLVKVSGLVEKPAAEDAPSNLAIIGRYVLQPDVFDVLEHTEPGRGGEIQLTDALDTMARNPEQGVHGVVFRGRRFDTGDKLSYIKAIIELALERDDLGDDLRSWMRDHYGSAQ
ncbi:UTP--glucose-1-phosphate uridylyltransferase GalU [Agrococcus casei]|uniref:UTP--glucose-1-phosphate uridylyltransferase GalU n=2 Tax=Agrococcus casei TaxID=343512 RepID=UPI003F8F300A